MEGPGGLVSRVMMGITGFILWPIGVINLLSQSTCLSKYGFRVILNFCMTLSTFCRGILVYLGHAGLGVHGGFVDIVSLLSNEVYGAY